MFNDCPRHEQGKLPVLHQFGQQERVLGSESGRIEDTGFDVRSLASYGESSRVQIANATVRLQHVFLKRQEPQVFGATHQGGAIADEAQLKAIVLE